MGRSLGICVWAGFSVILVEDILGDQGQIDILENVLPAQGEVDSVQYFFTSKPSGNIS